MDSGPYRPFNPYAPPQQVYYYPGHPTHHPPYPPQQQQQQQQQQQPQQIIPVQQQFLAELPDTPIQQSGPSEAHTQAQPPHDASTSFTHIANGTNEKPANPTEPQSTVAAAEPAPDVQANPWGFFLEDSGLEKATQEPQPPPEPPASKENGETTESPNTKPTEAGPWPYHGPTTSMPQATVFAAITDTVRPPPTQDGHASSSGVADLPSQSAQADLPPKTDMPGPGPEFGVLSGQIPYHGVSDNAQVPLQGNLERPPSAQFTAMPPPSHSPPVHNQYQVPAPEAPPVHGPAAGPAFTLPSHPPVSPPLSSPHFQFGSPVPHPYQAYNPYQTGSIHPMMQTTEPTPSSHAPPSSMSPQVGSPMPAFSAYAPPSTMSPSLGASPAVFSHGTASVASGIPTPHSHFSPGFSPPYNQQPLPAPAAGTPMSPQPNPYFAAVSSPPPAFVAPVPMSQAGQSSSPPGVSLAHSTTLPVHPKPQSAPPDPHISHTSSLPAEPAQPPLHQTPSSPPPEYTQVAQPPRPHSMSLSSDQNPPISGSVSATASQPPPFPPPNQYGYAPMASPYPAQSPYGLHPPSLPPRPLSSMGIPQQQIASSPYNPQAYGGPPAPMTFAPPPGAPVRPDIGGKLWSSKTVKKFVDRTANIIEQTVTPMLNDPRFRPHQQPYGAHPQPQGQYPSYYAPPQQGSVGAGPSPMAGGPGPAGGMAPLTHGAYPPPNPGWTKREAE